MPSIRRDCSVKLFFLQNNFNVVLCVVPWKVGCCNSCFVSSLCERKVCHSLYCLVCPLFFAFLFSASHFRGTFCNGVGDEKKVSSVSCLNCVKLCEGDVF